VRAGQQLPVALRRATRGCGAFDVSAQDLGIDAVPVEEIGFGGPAGAAGIAAIGGGDQVDDGVEVGQPGGAEVQSVIGGHHPNM
jgi:hypothetical protein